MSFLPFPESLCLSNSCEGGQNELKRGTNIRFGKPLGAELKEIMNIPTFLEVFKAHVGHPSRELEESGHGLRRRRKTFPKVLAMRTALIHFVTHILAD